MTLNREAGLEFQGSVLTAKGLAENFQVFEGPVPRIVNGAATEIGVKCRPDAVLQDGILEVKNVKCLSATRQLRAMINSGRRVTIVVNAKTKASGNLLKLLEKAGGTIEKFDPSSGTFNAYH